MFIKDLGWGEERSCQPKIYWMNEIKWIFVILCLIKICCRKLFYIKEAKSIQNLSVWDHAWKRKNLQRKTKNASSSDIFLAFNIQKFYCFTFFSPLSRFDSIIRHAYKQLLFIRSDLFWERSQSKRKRMKNELMRWYFFIFKRLCEKNLASILPFLCVKVNYISVSHQIPINR